jgi:hypothetical protein
VERTAEQERVLLSSVPYAMKSADAESLAGHAASDFVTQEQLAQLALAAAQPGQKGVAVPEVQPPTGGTVTGSGTPGTVPLWTGADVLGNSEITQVGTNIGIGEANPSVTLEVNGPATFHGGFTLPELTAATTTAGQRSHLFVLSSSAWSTTANAPVGQSFFLYSSPESNNKANPSGELVFQFKEGTGPGNTILKMASNGVLTFAPTQTFPGTITSVSATSPVTATNTSGAVSLGLNTSALVTDIAPAITTAITPNLVGTFNAMYPQLGTYNTFTSGASFGNTISAVTTSADAVYADVTGAGFAGYFVNNTTADSTVYAENDATGNPGLGIALKGYVPSAYSIGVLGKSAGNSSYGVFGENVGGSDGFGVYASATGPGSTAIYGSSTGGADSNYVVGNGVVGVSSNGRGVVGTSKGSSAVGGSVGPNGTWGVWGDSASGVGLGGGVLGTSDAGYAGYFDNSSTATPTIQVTNHGNYAAAEVFNTSSVAPALDVSNSGDFEAAGMANTSNTHPTLVLINSGTGGITDARTKTGGPATDTLFKTLMASTPSGTCGIGGNGDLSCTGQVKSLVSTNGGARKVETYAMQSPENWMEDFGSGDLQQGVAVVGIDAAFAETVSETPDYRVFLTPKGDSKGLYVINETASSFEVRESGGGTSSLAFDYRIVAKRRGYEAQRLKDVTERFNTESQATKPAKSVGASQDARPQPFALEKPGTQDAPRGPQFVHPIAAKAALQQESTTQP